MPDEFPAGPDQQPAARDERPAAPGRRGISEPGQQQPAAAPDRAALAAEALAEVRADAQARGARRLRPAIDNFVQQKSRPAGAAARRSGRQRRDDPAPLDAAISGLVADTGWGTALTTGSVLGRWAQIVGPDLAAHTVPDGLADGELTVTADSTAWATQLRLLASDLVRRLNAELGDGSVRRVRVRGPAGPPRRPGEWRVRGGRGPRDTYG